MRKILIVFILLFLVACAPRIYNVEEALVRIQDLDATYNTAFKEEMINKLILGQAEMEQYLVDLKVLRKSVATNDERQKRSIDLLFETRKQMLISQISFQKGWFGIGSAGRVSDKFTCSDIDHIQEETLLLEKAWSFGNNATKVLDALLSSNDLMQRAIGIGENKPEFYNSDFEGIYREIQSNVIGMQRFCGLVVETKYIDFTKRLQEDAETHGIGGQNEGT